MKKAAHFFLSTVDQLYLTSYLTLIYLVICTFILSQVSTVVTSTSKSNTSAISSASIVVTSHFTHHLTPSNDSSPAKYHHRNNHHHPHPHDDQLMGEDEKSTGQVHSRKKRGIMELAGMISCVTGCDPIKYKGYGCYCGYSGVGMPVDAIDRCCFHHDNCYTRTGCTQLKQYMLPYSYDCATHGYAICANPYGNDCASRLCRCDLKFAHCLSSYRCPLTRKRCGSPRLLLSLLSLG